MASGTIDEALAGGGRLQGFCAPPFAGVAEAFRRNFAERREVGAVVCLTHQGAVVVDLWGGLADAERGGPWERDTVWSRAMSSIRCGLNPAAATALSPAATLQITRPSLRICSGRTAAATTRGLCVRKLTGPQASRMRVVARAASRISPKQSAARAWFSLNPWMSKPICSASTARLAPSNAG
jgi:hypothetical protein